MSPDLLLILSKVQSGFTQAIDVEIYLELELLVKHRLQCFSENLGFIGLGLVWKKIHFHIGVRGSPEVHGLQGSRLLYPHCQLQHRMLGGERERTFFN